MCTTPVFPELGPNAPIGGAIKCARCGNPLRLTCGGDADGVPAVVSTPRDQSRPTLAKTKRVAS